MSSYDSGSIPKGWRRTLYDVIFGYDSFAGKAFDIAANIFGHTENIHKLFWNNFEQSVISKGQKQKFPAEDIKQKHKYIKS